METNGVTNYELVNGKKRKKAQVKDKRLIKAKAGVGENKEAQI